MSRQRPAPSWLPWVFCWVSSGLLLTGAALHLAHPEGPEDGAVLIGIRALVLCGVALVGALIAARLPSNPYGWLWCALGAMLALLAANDGIRRTGVMPSWITGLVEMGAFPAVLSLLVLVLLLFPTGRLPGRRWRWLVGAALSFSAAMLVLAPFGLPSGDPGAPPWAPARPVADVVDGVLDASISAMFLLMMLASLSVLVRFRRAGPIERQQLKWFLLAAGALAATTAVDLLGLPVSDQVWAAVDAATFSVLPLAVGIAVLRYRLYDIDRIISRTVSWGLLTAGVVALYLGLVALLRPLLEPLTGSSALAVAGSTLAVAAVFDPARRRLQAAVDRRFDRARYDAVRAVDAFAVRLRSQVDLDQIAAGLRGTVAGTVAPTHVAVWLRVPSPSEGPAS